MFVNRLDELAALERWWAEPGARLALVWGRRRVGKTALVRRFAEDRPTVFHVGAQRPAGAEVAQLLGRAERAGVDLPGALRRRSAPGWDDALDALATSATEPLLVVLDEFPELLDAAPELPSLIRALWEDVSGSSKLRLLLCGSAVRTMEALAHERAPLYGRVDLSLQVHPFAPHEAALMLPTLSPAERARVWTITGGTPLYLSWWDQDQDLAANLDRLVADPGGRLLNEGSLLVTTEADSGDLGRRVLYAIAAGRTKHHEIADAVGADPTRTLDRLVALRLLDRLTPVTDDPRRTRRRVYRIADNFLAFWLGIVERYRSEIELGLGRSARQAIVDSLDDHAGPRWEEAFRSHLRRMVGAGELDPDIVAIGPAWRDGVGELDAVGLAGRSRSPVLIGEAVWARVVDGARLAVRARLTSSRLGLGDESMLVAIAGRDEVTGLNGPTEVAVTAADIFALR